MRNTSRHQSTIPLLIRWHIWILFYCHTFWPNEVWNASYSNKERTRKNRHFELENQECDYLQFCYVQCSISYDKRDAVFGSKLSFTTIQIKSLYSRIQHQAQRWFLSRGIEWPIRFWYLIHQSKWKPYLFLYMIWRRSRSSTTLGVKMTNSIILPSIRISKHQI